ncbi:DUF1488 domain-containing protein [Budvicia diplopodorum]|uniref:DUF1488 domain-containing protein n=1 Tax=Budvicia diplopodorum TaxID=1119056 RepID=UPI00135AFFE6|nr:DUF1488 domain-containing protein [Budvicia diplopodorum]
MNQAIQFSDREEWDPIRKAVTCTALDHGFLINCRILAESLELRFGSSGAPEHYLSLFRLHRWDFEEELEALIADREFDADGWVTV